MHRCGRSLLIVGLLVLFLVALPVQADREADLARFERDFKEIRADDLKALIRLFKWCLGKELFEPVSRVGDKIIEHPDLTVEDYKLLAMRYCRVKKPDIAGEERKLLLELSSGFKAIGSNHYLILHDGEPDFAESRREWLEKGVKNFYLYMSEIGIYPRFLPRRMIAIVFDDNKGYNNYGSKRGVPPYMSAGFYSMLDNRLAIYNERKGAGYRLAQGAVRMQAARVRDMARQLKSIPGPGRTKILATLGGRTIKTTKKKFKKQLMKEYAKLKSKRSALKRLANRINVSKTLHEGAHQLAFNVGVQQRMAVYPLWVSEGLATVFETAGDSTGWGPRRVNPSRSKRLKRLIKNNKARSVLQLVAFDGRYKHQEDALNVYAESYGLFYYLLRAEPDKLRAYLRDLRTRDSEKIEIKFEPGKTDLDEIDKKFEALHKKWQGKEVELFEKHFGKDLDGLTRKWRRFIKDLRAR